MSRDVSAYQNAAEAEAALEGRVRAAHLRKLRELGFPETPDRPAKPDQ